MPSAKHDSTRPPSDCAFTCLPIGLSTQDRAKGEAMKPSALLLALALAGCDRFGDHPEAFIRVSSGIGDEIQISQRDGYLFAEGVWTLDGSDKIASPINLSEIRCIQSDGMCEISRVEIMTMSGRTTMYQRSDFYKITAWSDREVRAVLEEPCRTYEMRFDIPGKGVTDTTFNTPGGSCEGELRGPVEKPRIARLISGEQLEAIKMDGL